MILQVRKRLIRAVLCCIAAAFMTFAVGCSDKAEPGTTDKAVTLAVPIVEVDGEGNASWRAVEHASGYAYKISDGEEQLTDALSVMLEKGQSISVKAKGDGKKYKDSAYSTPITYSGTDVPVDPDENVEYTVSTEPGATVTVTTNVKSYAATADGGTFKVRVPKSETVLSITSSKSGYFTGKATVTSATVYDIPLNGSVSSAQSGMKISGDDFDTLVCSYYAESSGAAAIKFTDDIKAEQVVKFTLVTLGAGKNRADGSSSDGTPLNKGLELSDADRFVEFKMGKYSCRILSDGSVTGMERVTDAPYLSMYTALTQNTDAVDFAVALHGDKAHYFAKSHGVDKYVYIGRNSGTSGTLEFRLGGMDGFAQNMELRNFEISSGAEDFIAAAESDSEFYAVSSAARRNADGTVSAVIGNGISSGYLYDTSRSYDVSRGTLTLTTKIYSYGGKWQFHGFYIVDGSDTGKHYNIGITQGNNIWLSWSNGDRDYNGFPGRVPVGNTSTPGTFGSYNAHGGWLNSGGDVMFEGELKLVLNGRLADLYLNGKRIVRVDVFELFDKNATSGGGAAGADSTSKLPGNEVYAGLYAFSDPCKYRTLFDEFTVEYDEVADIERDANDTNWKTQIYAGGAPLTRDFILSGNVDIGSAEFNGRAVFRLGDNGMGLLMQNDGKMTVACGENTDFDFTGGVNDVFDFGFGMNVKFELAVTENSAALFIDDVLRVVYNGINASELFEYYAQGMNVTLENMRALKQGDDGYAERMGEIAALLDSHADEGFVCVDSTKRDKPVIVISESGEVTATQAQNAALVYSVDGGEFKHYADGITLAHGQSITVKALGDGASIGASQAFAVYYDFEPAGGKVNVSHGDGKITVEADVAARGEVFILVVQNRSDIYTWTDGGALGMAQTAADGDGNVSVEITADIPQGGAWVFVITEEHAYAAEVK